MTQAQNVYPTIGRYAVTVAIRLTLVAAAISLLAAMVSGEAISFETYLFVLMGCSVIVFGLSFLVMVVMTVSMGFDTKGDALAAMVASFMASSGTISLLSLIVAFAIF